MPRKRQEVFLVDGHPAIREGLKTILAKEGFKVCGDAADHEQALKGVASTSPDIVVVGLNLEEQKSMHLIAELTRRGLPVVAYCSAMDWRDIEDSFAAGASGFVCKAEPASSLIVAVRQVLLGESSMSEQPATCMAKRLSACKKAECSPKLSKQESRVLTLLGAGHPADQITAELCVSSHTVTSYCRRTIRKAGLSGMKELRQYAIRQKLQDRSDQRSA